MLNIFKKKKINKYLKNILNGVYDFNVDESKELEKDILKISQILKLKNELIMMYEKILYELYNKTSNKDEFENLMKHTIKMIDINNKKEELKFENIKLSSLISRSLESISSNGIEFKLNIKNTNLYIDIDLTKEVITNVINILLKYTEKQIMISSNVNALYTEIRISNDGKFMNEEVSYILKKMIEIQNGIFEIEMKENIGTTFIFKFNKN